MQNAKGIWMVDEHSLQTFELFIHTNSFQYFLVHSYSNNTFVIYLSQTGNWN